jgi:HK97 family phage prohead protease
MPGAAMPFNAMLSASADVTHPFATIHPDGMVEGYASLFGEIDQARDMVMPGAFTQTLRIRGVHRVPMLFQHDPAEPVGVWLELREDMRGLFVRGRLIPEVMRGRELLALLRAGTSDGLSIGFRTVKSRIEPRTRIRKLDIIDLWEISLVTFPLLAGARVRAVKAAALSPRPRHSRLSDDRTVRAEQQPLAAGTTSLCDAPARTRRNYFWRRPDAKPHIKSAALFRV